MGTMFVLLTALLLYTLFEPPVAARISEGGGLGRHARSKTRLPEVTCNSYASCAPDVDHNSTCFCDPLCRVFDDCCPDYQGSSTRF